MSRRLMKSLTGIIAIYSIMGIGAMAVIAAQAMNLLPFFGQGKDLFQWLVDDPTVALWLQPGLFYLAVIFGLALSAICNHSISQAIKTS